jgi:hypothetical protein
MASAAVAHAKKPAIQLLANSIRWTKGAGKPPEADPIRTRWMRSARDQAFERQANVFFAQLYQEAARLMSGIEGGALTGPKNSQRNPALSANLGEIVMSSCTKADRSL